MVLATAVGGPEALGAQAADSTATLGERSSRLGHTVGSAEAPIHVIEFTDLGCRECANFSEDTWPSLLSEYVETGAVRWQVIPYVSGLQPNGEEGARAVECAAEQDAFWPMQEMLYARQGDWFLKRRPQRQFGRYVEELGLDKEGFEACYRARDLNPRTERHNELALEAGVRATPTFLVNGRMVIGALPLSEFRKLLEAGGTP